MLLHTNYFCWFLPCLFQLLLGLSIQPHLHHAIKIKNRIRILWHKLMLQQKQILELVKLILLFLTPMVDIKTRFAMITTAATPNSQSDTLAYGFTLKRGQIGLISLKFITWIGSITLILFNLNCEQLLYLRVLLNFTFSKKQEQFQT